MNEKIIAVVIWVVIILLIIRNLVIRAKFFLKYGGKIKKENEEIIRVWKRERPDQKTIVIERKFKPSAFLAPTIKIKQTFTRKD